MKKFIAILAVAALGVLIAGCGKKEETLGQKLDSGINATGKAASKAQDDASNDLDDLK